MRKFAVVLALILLVSNGLITAVKSEFGQWPLCTWPLGYDT